MMSSDSFCLDRASCSNSDSPMAQQPQSKRARVEIEVPSFEKVDLSQFTLKDHGKGKNGHRAFPSVTGESVRFNLTPGGWLKTPFGFDVDTKFEKPSFLGGKEPENPGTPEGLNLCINIDKVEADFLTQLDGLCKDGFDELVKGTKWTELVGENPLFGTFSAKVTVVLKGEGLTKIAVVADNKVTRGEGWDFLKPFLDSQNGFRQAQVKLVVRVKKLWNVAGKAGIKLEATQMVLRPTERPKEADAFADDSELLE